ncbi:hypothetical protein BGW37DRAFT_539251 [Umbelopsis sp. PMI_123]|nr:hypothetical protein BGW37DRAFT_539251 [Umbelopsis sp. PMI_123]
MGLGIPWPLIDEDMERNLEKVLLAYYCQHVPSESRMVLSTKLTRFRYATVLKLENTLRPSLLNYKFQKHLVSSRKITNSDHGELGSHQSAAVYNLGGQILGPYFNKLWKTPPLYNDLFIHSLDQHLHSKWQKSRQKEGGIEMEKVRQRNYERILYRHSSDHTVGIVDHTESRAQNYPPSFGGVPSNGIQDISAIAALFGTELCSDHLLNALSSGYLYSAVSGISMFGSLGLIKATIQVVVPQDLLNRIGMKCSNKVLSYGSNGQPSVIQLVMDTFVMPQSYISYRERYPLRMRGWSRYALLAAALNFCRLIPFSLPLNDNRVSPYWGFAVLRVGSSALGAASLPLTMLSMAIGERIFLPLIVWKFLLILSAFGVLIGYVGCFTYVQNFSNDSDVYVWLSLEIIMMMLRMAIWSWDPNFDNLY